MTIQISKEMKRFNHLLGEIEAAYHELSLKQGLSDSAAQILYTICNEGESCLLSEICHTSGISKQTVNSAIRKLEQEKIVYLETIDSKKKRVYLTEKGKALVSETVAHTIEIENEIYGSWAEEELESYLELTQRYLNALREKVQETEERK